MEKKKVLIVEDESIIAKDLQIILVEAGYDVPFTATNSKDALKYTEELMPDLILMDVVIQGPVDGITTAQIVNQIYDIPIVFLSAYSDKSTLERARSVGSFGYLLKPCDDRELLISVDFGIQKAQFERILKDHNKLLRSVICQIEPGAIVVDLHGKIDLLNPQAQMMLGWQDSEINKTSIEELIENFHEITKDQKDHYSGLFKTKKNGSLMFDFRLQKLEDNDKRPTGFLLYLNTKVTDKQRKTS